jgi:hypothetical protein
MSNEKELSILDNQSSYHPLINLFFGRKWYKSLHLPNGFNQFKYHDRLREICVERVNQAYYFTYQDHKNSSRHELMIGKDTKNKQIYFIGQIVTNFFGYQEIITINSDNTRLARDIWAFFDFNILTRKTSKIIKDKSKQEQVSD